MNRTIIIAEAGVNHNGDMKLAEKLIDVAANSGSDFVKFQSFKANKLVSPTAKKADYQQKNLMDGDDNQFEMLKNLELSHENHLQLISYCSKKGIKFLSTAFDVDGLDYLNALGVSLFKVPSGEITNFPYLRKLAEIGKPVIISTGMSSLEEIGDAMKIISQGVALKDITILHCNTEYPTPMKDVNLIAMHTIQKEFGVKVGYSDHTLGIEVPIASVALGAKVIEKHFTLDRSLPGPDHKASLEPKELEAMVTCIRNIELAISGNGKKKASKSEFKNKEIARKSIHTSRIVKKGEILTEANLVPLRPGNGISPMKWEEIIGKRVNRDFSAFELLTMDAIQ